MGEKAPIEKRSVEIENFLENLFKAEKGYVYTPTKNPATGHWQPHFYKWPQQKDHIVTHLLDQTKTKECYVAPSLFKAPNAEKPAWKGTYNVWVEFDGNAPRDTPSGIPQPTTRIQSSESGHEHWYWAFSELQTNRDAIEGLAKQLAYTLDSDKSGWDANQVLRPPGTTHHESGRRVTLLASSDSRVTFTSFTGLVTAPVAAVINTTFESLPEVQEVVAKYKWDDEAYDLFRKPVIEFGSRSSAMTRLCFECIEMGMTNEESYVILLNADDRWGKYKQREPESRAKVLINLISHCRGKKSVQAELSLSDSLAPIYSWEEFNNADIKPPVWLFDGYLADNGLGVIASDPGVGKSTLTMYLMRCAILGSKFLLWDFNPEMVGKIRAAFLSFEMQPSEVKGFLDEMAQGYTTENFDKLKGNFYIVPEGSATDLSKKESQQEILDRLLSREINFVVLDSLKAMTGLDDKKVDIVFDWINDTLRKKHGMTVIVIHHNRKPPAAKSERAELGLGDVYGNMGITAHATCVMVLQKRTMKNVLTVSLPKIRSAEEPAKFQIIRRPFLTFALSNEEIKDDDKEEVAEVDSGETTTDGNPNLFG